MDLLFTDVKCTPAEEDRRSFQVELAVQAQAVLRREVTLPVLTDLYSTTHELETQRDLCPVCRLVDQGEEQESLRETVETETVGALLDVQARLGRASQTRRGRIEFCSKRWNWSFSMKPRKGWRQPGQRATVQHRLPGQGTGTCTFAAELLREPTASPMGEGMEVSCPVAFRWMTVTQEETTVISRVTVGEKRRKPPKPPR